MLDTILGQTKCLANTIAYCLTDKIFWPTKIFRPTKMFWPTHCVANRMADTFYFGQQIVWPTQCFTDTMADAGNTKGGSITVPLTLFDWFGVVCFANKNKNCQLSYS
jgi:hypothetical protein